MAGADVEIRERASERDLEMVVRRRDDRLDGGAGLFGFVVDAMVSWFSLIKKHHVDGKWKEGGICTFN